MAAGNIIEGKPTIAQWRIVFLIAAAVYIVCATFYNIFATGERQPWDNPELDNQNFHTPKAVDNENGVKKRNVNIQETKYWKTRRGCKGENSSFIYFYFFETKFL